MKRLTDLRFVIGLFFLLTGSMLCIYSLARSEAGVNLWSGAVFVLFGAGMVLLTPKMKE